MSLVLVLYKSRSPRRSAFPFHFRAGCHALPGTNTEAAIVREPAGMPAVVETLRGAMRIRVRVLGADLIDVATGRDARDQPDETGPGGFSADVSASPQPFGIAAHDQQWTYPEEKR